MEVGCRGLVRQSMWIVEGIADYRGNWHWERQLMCIEIVTNKWVSHKWRLNNPIFKKKCCYSFQECYTSVPFIKELCLCSLVETCIAVLQEKSEMWKFYTWVLDRHVETDICKDEHSIKCYPLSLLKLLIMWTSIFLFL